METILHMSLADADRWLLWGESSAPGAAGRRRRRLDTVSQAVLIDVLDRCGMHSELDPHDQSQDSVWLPALSGGDALASSEDPDQWAGRRLVWVGCLHFPTADMVDLLRLLPPSPPPGVRYGDSLAWLRRFAALGLELLAHGQVVPDLIEPAYRGEPYLSVWQPVLATPGLMPRLRALATAAPGVVVAGWDTGMHPPPSAGDVLTMIVDACARRWLADAGWPSAEWGRPSGIGSAWLRSLADEAGAMPVPRRQGSQLVAAVRGWTAPLAGGESFALVLTLQEPEGTADWHLDYWLQSARDPSLLMPAATIWLEDEDWVKALRLAAARPQLIAHLGRAASVFEPIRASLSEAAPAALALTTAQVATLLLQAMPGLGEKGITVRVPDWWRAPVRPGVSLRLAPAEPAGLGLAAIASFKIEAALGDQAISADEVRALAAAKQSLVQVGHHWMVVDPDDLGRLSAFLDGRGTTGTVTPIEAVRLRDEAAELGDERIEASGWIGDILSGRLIERLVPVPVPEALQATLRPYQQRGLDWLVFCSRLGLGACLADDMGLGKTVQVLALLAAAREAGDTGPTLLVCPMSVVGNWQREAARFMPSLRLHVHHGSQRHQGDALADRLANVDLVITTYGLATRDRQMLAGLPWRRLVLDEAQHVKNPEARQTRAVAAIPADQRIAMTGTPIENRLDELWSIMRLLNPGLLGSRQGFQTHLAKPIEREGDPQALAKLKRLTEPFVLRRLKSDPTIIQDLPEKQEIKSYCNLTAEQASLYQAIVDDLLRRLDTLEPMARRGAILAAMTRLKQLCDHPALYLGDGSTLAGRSGKLELLEDCLTDVLAAGDKALVFTQFAEMGHLLQAHLQEIFAVPVPFLHGGTVRARRDRLVSDFQAEGGPPVLLLSLKAGGVGLNLTAATQVIHYDRWWNPAVETQATDRAYRIGQRRMVQVRPLICVGTLEEKIDQMIERKRDLADRVIGTGEGWLTELSSEQLREVLVLSADAMMED